MKLFSKIISAVAALSMVATMAVMPVAHAGYAGPVLKLTATPADTYVDLTVSYTGADAKMQSSGIKVDIGEGFAPAECPEDYEGSYWDAMLEDEMEGWSTAKPGLDGVTFVVQATQIVFATATSKTTAKATLDANCDNLFTVRLYPTKDYDPTADYQFSFTGQNTLSTYKDYQDTLVLDVTDAKLAGSGQAVTTYTVTADATVTVDKTEAAAGETVTVTPVVPSGKQVKEVKYNNTVITPVEGAYTFTMPEEDVTVTATFEDIPPVTYAVTAGEGIASVDKAEAEEGETVNFVVADAPAGKQLADITVNGTSIGKEATSFVMPAEAATVAATFEDIPDPDPEVEFEGDRVTANNAVGFWAKLAKLENAGEVKAAGFIFANVEEVGKDLETSQIKVADALGLGETITYEFKNLTGYDQFGLKGFAYVVTDKGPFISLNYFGDGLLDIAR